MPKRKTKLKDIVARSITLKDSKGETRMYLAVHDDPVYSTICLFGEHGRSIQISADHEGGLYISLGETNGKLGAALAVSSQDRVGLGLYDHRSGTRTEMGSTTKSGPHHITLHHHGKVNWTTRKHSGRKVR